MEFQTQFPGMVIHVPTLQEKVAQGTCRSMCVLPCGFLKSVQTKIAVVVPCACDSLSQRFFHCPPVVKVKALSPICSFASRRSVGLASGTQSKGSEVSGREPI